MNKNTIEFIKGSKGNTLSSLNKGYHLINDSLENLLNELVEKSKDLQSEREFDEVVELVEIQKDVNKSILQNKKTMTSLGVSNVQSSIPKSQTKYKQKKEKLIYPVRDHYEVDSSIPYNLDDDLRFKRPHAFQIGKHYEEIKTWKEMLVETCKYLYKVNPELFKSFVNDESMQWGDTTNFSNNKEKIREPYLIGDSKVYIEIAKGAMGVRQMIIKLLSKYEIDLSECKIYLRADYSIKRELDDSYRRRQPSKKRNSK